MTYNITTAINRVRISIRSELLRWFETEVHGSETKICQVSWIRSLQYQEVKQEHNEEAKTVKETAEQEPEAPFFLATHVNNILNSIFSNVEVYINNQHFYNSNGLYAHKCYISNNFKGAIPENKGVMKCEGYDYEDFLDKSMNAPWFVPFFTSRMKYLRRHYGFMLYGKLGVDFFAAPELMYPNKRFRLRLIRGRPIFYMINDNPQF